MLFSIHPGAVFCLKFGIKIGLEMAPFPLYQSTLPQFLRYVINNDKANDKFLRNQNSELRPQTSDLRTREVGKFCRQSIQLELSQLLPVHQQTQAKPSQVN